MGAVARNLLQVIAFLLELVAFVAVPALAWLAPIPEFARVLLAVVLGGLVIWFWGRFMAPRAAHRLGGGHYLAAKAVIYCVAAVSVQAHQGMRAASVFVALAVLDELLLRRPGISLVETGGDRPG